MGGIQKIIGLFILLFPLNIWGACDCGSTNSSSPCTGQSITVTVDADTPNGGTAVDNVYSWAFNSGGGDARCGQFANGDYWVAPAAGQSTVTITGITSSSHAALIKADVDPTTEAMGLLTGARDYGNYDADENIIPSLPISYSGINSLVAAIQRNEAAEGSCGTPGITGQCIDSYNVVTVLSSVPENAGSTVLRPNITGETKELISLSDISLSKVPSKSYLTGTDTAGLEAIRKRWSHSTEIFGLHNSVGTSAGYCSEAGRAYRSHAVIDDYGGGTAQRWNDDMAILFSDDNTIEAKTPAIAAMLSYGLDLYNAMYDPPSGVVRNWGSGATQHPGKFMPPVFLSALINDTNYRTTLKTASEHIHDYLYSGPHELSQLHIGSNGPVWGDIPSFTGVNYQGAYWDSLWRSQCYDGAPETCDTNYGEKTQADPYGYIDGPPNKPGGEYMPLSLGVQRAMVGIMFMMPEICEAVNYEAITTYVDRAESHGVQAGSDPCVTPDSRETIGGSCDPYRNTGCTYYGVTWGPVDPTDVDSVCITTVTPGYTQAGRFTSLDGDPITASYTSTQIESNWETIRNGLAQCQRLAKRYAVRVNTGD